MATRRWEGNAVDVTQVDTITIANTWATGDTCTMTINGKNVVLTAGTDVSTTNIATAIKEIWNGDTQTGTGDHTAIPSFDDFGGDSIGEFAGITATSSGAVVTLSADVAGVPFTLTVAATTAGNGTATRGAKTTCTGKHFFDNADNWSDDTVPVTADDIVFQNSDVDLLYAIDQNGTSPDSIKIYQSYTGVIGLDENNTDIPDKPYREYRDRFLKMNESGDSRTNELTIGIGEGSGSGRMNLNLHTGVTNCVIYNSGQRLNPNIPSINLIGGHSTNTVEVLRGDVGLAVADGDTTTVATLRIGYIENRDFDAQVYIGASGAVAAMHKEGGHLTSWSGMSGTHRLEGGTWDHHEGNLGTVKIRGGRFRQYSDGTLTTLQVSQDGVADFSRDIRAKVITNPVEIYGNGASLIDPFKTIGSLVVDINEGVNGLNLDLGQNMRLTRGNVA